MSKTITTLDTIIKNGVLYTKTIKMWKHHKQVVWVPTFRILGDSEND